MRRVEETIAYRSIRLAAGLILLALWAVLVTACASSQTATAEGSLPVYYLNKEHTTIVSETWIPDASMLHEDHAGDLVDFLLEAMCAPENATTHTAAITEDLWSSWEIGDGILTIDMTSSYRELDGIEETLVRAAIVNTLDCVRGVDGIALTVEGSPLVDDAGEEIGAQSSEDFIFSSDNELQAYEKASLHLYFADESGTRLVDTYRTVVYNSNIAQERLVVEEVLKGPNTDVVYPTIDSNTAILSVTTRDGICYVNLDQNFLTDPYDVTANVAIYSLVNSLTELSTVDAVQISVEGSSQETFLDVSLRNVFYRDLTIVGTTAQ